MHTNIVMTELVEIISEDFFLFLKVGKSQEEIILINSFSYSALASIILVFKKKAGGRI